MLIFSTSILCAQTVCPDKCFEDDGSGGNANCCELNPNFTTNPTGIALDFAWSTGATTATIDACDSGVYSVTATDPDDCATELVEEFEVTINPPPATQCRILGFGGNNGTVLNPFGDCELTFCEDDHSSYQFRVTPTGLSYAWTNSFGATSTTSILNATTASMGVGVHTASVVVTDANGCTSEESFTLTIEFCGCNLTPTCGTLVDPTCPGDSDGSITINENGVAPYIYAWTGGASGNPATGLAAGSYTVTVTDDDGCTGEVTCVLTDPTSFTILSAPACN